MATPKDSRPQDVPFDHAAVEEISKTVKLATCALDGLHLSDDELDALCEAALSFPKKKGFERPVENAHMREKRPSSFDMT